MANINDISELLGKEENEGSTEKGRLTANEWNYLVNEVINVQEKVDGTIKGIKYNETQIFNKIDENGYLEMTVADTSGYDVWLHVTNPPAVIARGSECPINVSVTNKVWNPDNTKSPNAASAIIEIYINDILVNSGNVYDIDFGNKESINYDPLKNTVYTFDLSTAKATALAIGTNSIKVKCNNRSGVVKDYNCDVEVIELSLTVNSFDKVFTESKKPNIIATVSGNDANINAKVDGQMIITNYAVKAGETNNLGEKWFDEVNNHGVHTLEVWAEVVRKTGGVEYTISTQPKIYTYIYGTTSKTPVVMSNISNTKPEEYSTLNVNYIAYKYNSNDSAITDIVTIELCEHLGYDDNGLPIAGNTLGEPIKSNITFDVITNSGSGSAGISLFPVTIDGKSVSLVGKRVIKISIGDFSQNTEIEVLESSVKLRQLGGYAVYLTSTGRNNNQANKREWICNDGKDKSGNKLVTNTIFSDNIEFIDTGSGWIADSDGNVAMHLKKGRYFTLDYQPFIDNPVYDDGSNNGTGRGKTISFELATRNCLKSDSPVITCMDDSNGSERGFLITASSAVLKSNNFGLQAKFRENTRIKIDFVIEGIKNEYTYTTIAGTDATENDWEKDKVSSEALCIIYVDGVYQGLKVIPNGTTFLQGRPGTPAPKIVFGSNDCDLDIYNIRIYDQSLTPAQIVDNYAYDTPKYEEKLLIAGRNDIFDLTSLGNKPNINIEKLRKARPELPFWYVRMDVDKDGNEIILPYDKSDWRKLPYTEWKNPMNENDKFGDAISFTTDAGQLRNQGTSSMTYPWPWRNWDWRIKSGKFNLGIDGDKADSWCQYRGMSDTENLKKITLKKDYASSEMCNNAITSEYYTDMALAIGGTYPNVLSPAMRELGINTPYRMTFKAIPCFMFQEFTDSNKAGTAGKGYEALGMMNLIANKNECGHLGFMNKHIWNPTEGTRAQSWELSDNMDDWFWYKKIEPIRVESYTDNEGNNATRIINNCLECYEARYPKDSTLNETLWNSDDDEADFGGVPDGYVTINSDQIAAIEDEQYDIIEFHNWLVDCNRQIAEDYKEANGDYRLLSGDEANWEWNKNDDGTYNKYDNPTYRLKKFIAEAPTRMIVDQFCLYYIWRETFWAFDSGFKNLQLYTMGKAPVKEGEPEPTYYQWGCMVRDADTTLGIQNTGKDIFPPHLEDTDYYTADKDAEGNAVSNVEFVYGAANGLYHAKSLDKKGGNTVLNGQFGTLWINLRDGFGARIATIYRALKASSNSGWNASSAIKRFRGHQEKWCENLYNFGMRQYFGGAPFVKWIESGLGDKKNSRASWLERGFYYRESKYKCLSDVCTIRATTYETPDLDAGNTINEPLKMKAYIPMYFLCGATTQEPTSPDAIQIRVTDTNNTFDVIPGPGGLGLATTGDQNRWFWGSSQLTEIGDLARVCKFEEIQQLNLPKVREFSIGHEKDRDGKTYKEYYYENVNGVSTRMEREFENDKLSSITVDSLKQMTVLDVTNHRMLNSIAGLDECNQLQEFYARGTDSLTSISLPATTSIKVLYLGKSLVNLNLNNLTGIEKFELEGADRMEKLFINNCGPYMASRSYDIVRQALPSLESKHHENNRNVCQLNGINWNLSDQNAYTYIERLLNIDAQLSGYISMKSLPNKLKISLIERYGNIDDPNNSLYIQYTQEPITSVTLPSKIYIYEEGEYNMAERLVVNPEYANTYSKSVWTIDTNNFATISEEGILIRNSEICNEEDIPVTLTAVVSQMPESDGTPREDITVTCQVYFYERVARIGDIVFNDGTYSDELDSSKTPIGVCFYIDPDDKTNRLMCATNRLDKNYAWGPYSGFKYNNESIYLGNDPNIKINGVKFNFDIDEIPNLQGVGTNSDISYIFLDDIYRNSLDDNNNKFQTFGGLKERMIYGNIGWIPKIDGSLYYEMKIDTNTEIKIGDSIPIGYYNTIAMIYNRNRLLDSYKNTKEGKFIQPKETANETEASNLITLIGKADKWSYESWNYAEGGDTYGSLLYFPAASACFAYEPNAINLNDKFKKHNWFLPSSGELARIMYYVYQSYDRQNGALESPKASIYGLTHKDAAANAFYNAINLGVFNAYSVIEKEYLSSSEYIEAYRKVISINAAGKFELRDKYSNSYYVIPVCRF